MIITWRNYAYGVVMAMNRQLARVKMREIITVATGVIFRVHIALESRCRWLEFERRLRQLQMRACERIYMYVYVQERRKKREGNILGPFARLVTVYYESSRRAAWRRVMPEKRAVMMKGPGNRGGKKDARLF